MYVNCAICTDLLNPSDEAHATKCGHIFHLKCLNQWLERSKTCPQCRCKLTSRDTHRIFFNIALSDNSVLDVGTLQSDNDNLKLEINLKKEEIKNLNEDYSKKVGECLLLEDQKEKLKHKLGSTKHYAETLKYQNTMLKSEISQVDVLKTELKEVREQIQLFQTVEKVVKLTVTEVETLLNNEHDPKVLAVLVSSLKRELATSNNRLQDMKTCLKNSHCDYKQQREANKQLFDKNTNLESEIFNLRNKIRISDEKENNHDMFNSEKQRKFSLDNTITNSTSIDEQIKQIESSSSPYLDIKSSNIRLTYGAPAASNVLKSKFPSKPPLGLLVKKSRLDTAFCIQKKGNTNSNFSSHGSLNNYAKSISDRVKSGKIKNINFNLDKKVDDN